MRGMMDDLIQGAFDEIIATIDQHVLKSLRDHGYNCWTDNDIRRLVERHDVVIVGYKDAKVVEIKVDGEVVCKYNYGMKYGKDVDELGNIRYTIKVGD